ncbi:Heat shock transcription factor [Rhynchospora pubera]|uniref:Heat shock transcription factor n=1 Tax=Rhynchospora pubera TaxID=906938 RepID=A0AAV8F9R3_9POAL|nr:Heat shock transcription factor [Rhynchospora pubera]KAJ4787553.1 Heat shock transcription factor [Rhynchospora pubera]KAJ4806812.1 Heat shock transcription factor [Rhynchospora pubera]
MDTSQNGSGGPPPFLTKTYEMVEDPSTDDVVSWGPTNSSFIVWNPPEFSRDLLPKYFKHNNFSSFIRQLNTYGFRKIDPDQWEFANEDFIRGQRHLLKNIHRRKPVHSHSVNNNSHLAEEERHELEDEIERLKREKISLIADLHKHTETQQNMDQRMQYLENRLQSMEMRQRNLLNFVSQTIQKPGMFTNFEHHAKKRRLPKVGSHYDQTQIVTSFTAFEKMESSLSYLENLFRGVSQASGEDVCYYDNTVPCAPSVVLTEIQVQPAEADKFLLGPAPEVEASSYAPSPTVPLTELPEEGDLGCNKAGEIDMNTEPEVGTRQVDLQKDRVAGCANTNDTFWEQFLTDNPITCVEVKSEESCEGMMSEIGSIWSNKSGVDRIIDKLGHLTPAGQA